MLGSKAKRPQDDAEQLNKCSSDLSKVNIGSSCTFSMIKLLWVCVCCQQIVKLLQSDKTGDTLGVLIRPEYLHNSTIHTDKLTSESCEFVTVVICHKLDLIQSKPDLTRYLLGGGFGRGEQNMTHKMPPMVFPMTPPIKPPMSPPSKAPPGPNTDPNAAPTCAPVFEPTKFPTDLSKRNRYVTLMSSYEQNIALITCSTRT